MNKIELIKLSENNRWDEIVTSFNNYSPFYLSAYCRAFKHNGDGEPILLYYNYNNTRGINVIIRRDISDDKNFNSILEREKYYDLITPYGYGGFIIEGNDYKELVNEYNKFCIENGYICEFVRFDLFSDYHTLYDGQVETRTHNIIRNLEIPLEDMLMDFEHKVRKNIKKANSYGLQIKIDENDEMLEDFLKIYYSTMERNNANSSYYFDKEFFNIINEMKKNKIYFYVLYEGKVISTELVLYDNKNCYSYLGGTLNEYFNMRPNDFLKYEIIKWAINKDLKNFVLGGGYGSDDGIFQYKKSFAPNGICDFYIGRKIFNKEIYNKLVNMRIKSGNFEKESNFFPLYRS